MNPFIYFVICMKCSIFRCSDHSGLMCKCSREKHSAFADISSIILLVQNLKMTCDKQEKGQKGNLLMKIHIKIPQIDYVGLILCRIVVAAYIRIPFRVFEGTLTLF